MSQLDFDFGANGRSKALPADENVKHVADALGALPKHVRYFDEYEEKIRTIDAEANIWRIEANGNAMNVDFTSFDRAFRTILKHFGAHRLQKNAVTGRLHLLTLVATRGIQSHLVARACAGPDEGLEFLRVGYFAEASTTANSLYFSTGKALLSLSALV